MSIEKSQGEERSELVIKHPLEYKWCFWYYKNDKFKLWEENLIKIASFDTVEDFWALYNHIERPSKLSTGCDYAVFKEGIKPMWEDEKNQAGGRWVVNVAKHLRTTDLDNYWLETLLCMIGEMFDDYNDEICGVVVQIRARVDRIGLWTSNIENKEKIIRIGRKLKETLYNRRSIIGYEAHVDTWTKKGSMAKYRYEV
ncbi:eukaryotic translation initiation factor 4E-like [Centruroides sculpturatus]|uniref:eukaryotic translation initiation factor 4E-like n=1 Tax=Centruroides sculpturatus TaxID=218467 RepID=UPI000C6DFBA5|nr:eukaryotic translation initiation factor 4E-like [Centruroides sculpturatus]